MKHISLLLFLTYSTLVLSQSSIQANNGDQIFDEKLYLKKGNFVHQGENVFRVQKQIRIQELRNTEDSTFLQTIYDRNYLKLVTGDSTQLPSFSQHPETFYVLRNGSFNWRFNFTDWDIHALTIPIKIRPRLDNTPLQFVGDVAIGPYLGFQFGSKKSTADDISQLFATTICAFLTPTYVRIDPTNTMSSADATSASTLLGISTGAGLLFNLNSTQIGFVSGLDWIGGNASESWLYQGKYWYSVSIGFQLDKD